MTGFYKTARPFLALFILAIGVCGSGQALGGDAVAKEIEQPQATPTDSRISKLTCISLPIDRARLALEGLEAYRNDCLPELKQKIAPGGRVLSDRFYNLVLATIVAHYFAPYGESSATTYDQILKQRTLNCGNYGILLSLFSKEFGLDFVGYDGGIVGNHQQLFERTDGQDVLFDPTIGAIAFISFDELLSGKPARKVFSFFSEDPVIQNFNRKVLDAVREGKFKPSDLLYFYPNYDTFFHPKDIGPFLTPGGVAYRARLAVQ